MATDASSTARKKQGPTRTRKASAKKAPVEKSAEKAPTKKRAPASKTAKQASATPARSARAPRAEASPQPSPAKLASRVAGELADLTSKSVEGVTGLERTEEGWTVEVEVVEVRRIPDTTDVLALYEVTTDAHGALQGYRRLRRYSRGSSGEGR
jgi:hypothetical protein